MSAFSLLQQQRGVPHESAAAEHPTLIAVAAAWMHADDVVTGAAASPVRQNTPTVELPIDVTLTQAGVVSPVFVQVPPQVPDGFWAAHFQYEDVVPVFWLDLQGDEVTTGGMYHVKCFF